MDYVAQDKENWRAHVNTVKNLRIPLDAGNYLTT